MGTKKVVINADYGGFGLSAKAFDAFNERTRKRVNYAEDIPRDSEILVEIVENLGEEANDEFSDLKVVEIPDNVKWEIEEYDGMEWIAEVHRTWR